MKHVISAEQQKQIDEMITTHQVLLAADSGTGKKLYYHVWNQEFEVKNENGYSETFYKNELSLAIKLYNEL